MAADEKVASVSFNGLTFNPSTGLVSYGDKEDLQATSFSGSAMGFSGITTSSLSFVATGGGTVPDLRLIGLPVRMDDNIIGYVSDVSIDNSFGHAFSVVATVNIVGGRGVNANGDSFSPGAFASDDIKQDLKIMHGIDLDAPVALPSRPPDSAVPEIKPKWPGSTRRVS